MATSHLSRTSIPHTGSSKKPGRQREAKNHLAPSSPLTTKKKRKSHDTWQAGLPKQNAKKNPNQNRFFFLQIQKLSELTRVPLVSCRPWLCTPRDYGSGPVGPVRPVAALLPQHLQMTICEVSSCRGGIFHATAVAVFASGRTVDFDLLRVWRRR